MDGIRRTKNLPQTGIFMTESNIYPYFFVTISDGYMSVKGTVIFDKGSDDRMFSPGIVEQAVIKGVRRITVIKTVLICVVLKEGEITQEFSF